MEIASKNRFGFKYSWFTAILALGLLPFVALSYFVFPSADDFTYANTVRELGFWQAQTHYYQSWSGRYFATFLMSLNPLVKDDHFFYGGFALLAILVIFASFWFVLSAFLRNLADRRMILFYTFVFTVMYLFRMPGVNEGIYWFPGLVNHTLSLLPFAIAFSAAAKVRGFSLQHLQFKMGSFVCEFGLFVTLTLCAFIMIGLNESILFIWDLLVLVLFIYTFIKYRRIDWTLLAVGILSLVFSLVVFLCPGNNARSSMFTDARSVTYTLEWSAASFLRHVFRFLTPPFLLFLVFDKANLEKISAGADPQFKTKKFAKTTLAIFFAIIFLFFIPSYYGTGCLPPKRNLNILLFFHSVLICLLMLWLIHTRNKTFLKVDGWIQKLSSTWQMLLFLVLFMAFGHERLAWMNLINGAPTYYSEYSERLELLRVSAGQSLVVPRLSQEPETIFFDDIIENSQDWRNTSVATYYKLTSIVKK